MPAHSDDETLLRCLVPQVQTRALLENLVHTALGVQWGRQVDGYCHAPATRLRGFEGRQKAKKKATTVPNWGALAELKQPKAN